MSANRRQCAYQGEGCLGEFEPKSPNQKNCDVCHKPARKAHNLARALSAYRADPEKFRRRGRRYRAKNRKAARARARLYHAEHRERINLLERARRARTREKYAAKQRARNAANPTRQRAIAKRSREKHKAEINRKGRDRAKRIRELAALAKLMLTERRQSQTATRAKPGPKEKPKENKKYFKIADLVEKKLNSGVELTAARRLVAKQAGIAYASVARYHKEARRLTAISS